MNELLWGIPTVCLILGTGLIITLICGAPQIRLLGKALGSFWSKLSGRSADDDGSSYQSLCTALAATVGTGNIAGVAGAIAIGGPGAIFWMWVSAFFGMATKYAESTLAVRFCDCGSDGMRRGGTMYMVEKGLARRYRFLALLYSFFGLFAAFGVGNATQMNAVVTALGEAGAQYGYALPAHTPQFVGAVLGLLVVLLVSGGAKRIGEAAESLIPAAAGAYVLVCMAAIWTRRTRIAGALQSILVGAFQPDAVTGGMVGGIMRSMRMGISRGVFTNEAGMGTAAMAHGSAQVSHPVEQGLMGIVEVFLDTIVICTLTALVILTGTADIPYGTEAGAELTARALSAGLGPWVSAFLCACLCLFALATILGWGLYAGRCAEFLLGSMNWKAFALIQGLCVLLGSVLDTGIVWSLSELMNALMTFPNLISLLFLMPELRHLTIEYTRHIKRGRSAAGGTYENFHQCKPLPAFSHEKVPPLRSGSRAEG